jgi:hypothetical protein
MLSFHWPVLPSFMRMKCVLSYKDVLGVSSLTITKTKIKKNAVFWDVTPCGSCKNRRFEGIAFLRSVRRLLVTANVPNSPILVTLMMGPLRSSETYVLTRGTWYKISEDGTLHSYCSENLKSHKE